MATSITATEHGYFQLNVGSDRPYTAISYVEFLKNLVSNGVLTRGLALSDELECTPSSGTMNTLIAAGVAVVQGHVMEFAEGGTVTHTTADVTHGRIDLIVSETNTEVGTRSDTAKLVTGTPSADPEAPALTQTSTIWQDKLCEVLVPANETDADNFIYTDYREAATAYYAPGENSLTLDRLVPLTANRALYADADGEIVPSAVTSTELGYLSGVTSAIQTQIDALNAAYYCRIRRTTSNQSSGTYIEFNDEISDANNMFDAGTDATKINILSTGYYMITANASIQDTTSSAEYGRVNIAIDGSVVSSSYFAAPYGIGSGSISAALYLSSGNYVQIQANPDALGLSETSLVTISNTSFMIVKIK